MTAPRQCAAAYGDTIIEKLLAVTDEIWSLEYLLDMDADLRGGAVDRHLSVLRRYKRLLAYVKYQREHQLTLPDMPTDKDGAR